MSTLREKPAEYKGHVSNGVIVLDSPAALPDGVAVRVRPVGRRAKRKAAKLPPTLYERLKPIIGKAKGLPRDAALNVDHCLYGLPKKEP